MGQIGAPLSSRSGRARSLSPPERVRKRPLPRAFRGGRLGAPSSRPRFPTHPSPDTRCRYAVGSARTSQRPVRSASTVNDCGVWLTSRAPGGPSSRLGAGVHLVHPPVLQRALSGAGRAARPAPDRPPSRRNSRARRRTARRSGPLVDQPAPVALRGQAAFVEEAVALAVELAQPSAREREARRHVRGLPVVEGVDDLDAVALAHRGRRASWLSGS